MRAWTAVTRVPHYAGIVAHDPGQFRYIWRWVRSLRKSPLEVGLPWLAFTVIEELEGFIDASSRVFEFGGGGSTLWLANRAKEVTTVENDRAWFMSLVDSTSGLEASSVLFRDTTHGFDDYVHTIDEFPDCHFDLVTVDGRERVRCLEAALPKVAPGGLLLLDDSDRPRYARAFDLAAAWPHRTYKGFSPYKTWAGVTTVWQRPSI